MNIYCLALDYLFDATLPGEALVAIRIISDHFNQLMRSDEVVQDDHIFGDQ